MVMHVQVRGWVSLPYTYVTGEKFRYLARTYPDMPLELASDGRLLTGAPADAVVSSLNFKITSQLGEWTQVDGSGIGFSSRTGFTLPNGAIYAPHLSWVRRERWNALNCEQQQDFAPLYPDLVVEHLAMEYGLKRLRAKMREYRDNGTRLGWLFNVSRRRVEIYRPGQDVEVLDDPDTLSGEDVLPGFTLDLKRVWG